MAAFSSAGQLRRRPAPVNTSMRRARSGIGVSSEIDMCRSSKSAPNIILYARRRKVHPDDANEEARAAGDEASVRPDPAPRHDAVDVRVMGERLPPRVQDRDHPGLGAQMLRIGADGANGLGRGLEQDVVDDGLFCRAIAATGAGRVKTTWK